MASTTKNDVSYVSEILQDLEMSDSPPNSNMTMVSARKNSSSCSEEADVERFDVDEEGGTDYHVDTEKKLHHMPEDPEVNRPRRDAGVEDRRKKFAAYLKKEKVDIWISDAMEEVARKGKIENPQAVLREILVAHVRTESTPAESDIEELEEEMVELQKKERQLLQTLDKLKAQIDAKKLN